MAVNVSIKEWMEWLKTVEDKDVKRRERLIFDIAMAIVKEAKLLCRSKFGRGIGKTARTRGRSGALMNSIGAIRVSQKETKVTAGGNGVPYARIQELGTVGAGGELPTIVPKNAKWLTQPLEQKYVGRRAREFDLIFVPSKKRFDRAFLVDKKLLKTKPLKAAYLLRKSTDIPPRPYLRPAAEMVMMKDIYHDRVKKIYGENEKIKFDFVEL